MRSLASARVSASRFLLVTAMATGTADTGVLVAVANAGEDEGAGAVAVVAAGLGLDSLKGYLRLEHREGERYGNPAARERIRIRSRIKTWKENSPWTVKKERKEEEEKEWLKGRETFRR
jgi:hypothetical protein